MNIPDTINDARIRALMEPHGALVKIILRPDHQGAIVEFADVASVGKASLALEGTEITTGRKIGVGSVSEMLKQKAEWRRDKIVVGSGGGGGKKEPNEKSLQPSGPIRRPHQPAGSRMGRRGGLGVKRGLGFGGVAKNAAKDGDVVMKEEGVDGGEGKVVKEESKPKSNSDFKAMILGATKEPTEPTESKEPAV